MHGDLYYFTAHARQNELRQAAERERLAKAAQAERGEGLVARAVTQLRPRHPVADEMRGAKPAEAKAT
jgi:hypothetical protein